MTETHVSPDEQFLRLLDRLRELELDKNPLQDSGISMPQLAILDHVTNSPGCSLQELASGLRLTPPTVSVAARRLEEAGILARETDPGDGRAIRIALTAQGQALQRQAHAFRRKKAYRLLATLTVDDAATLLSLLDRALTAAEASDEAQGSPRRGD
ncbi:MAG: MarR family transcriptional regulator [Anaerolineales bacterium]|nr:MarR family transcriptional regulator [Anaerolineales bacterium]